MDVERLYNLLCFEELKKQGDEEAKYNPSRSWGQLKSAVNVWFDTRLGLDRAVYYPIVVNELLQESSELKTAISKALKEFRKKYGKDMLTLDFVILVLVKKYEKNMDRIKLRAIEDRYIKKPSFGKLLLYFRYHNENVNFLKNF